jgi:hypothetical protein
MALKALRRFCFGVVLPVESEHTRPPTSPFFDMEGTRTVTGFAAASVYGAVRDRFLGVNGLQIGCGAFLVTRPAGIGPYVALTTAGLLERG